MWMSNDHIKLEAKDDSEAEKGTSTFIPLLASFPRPFGAGLGVSASIREEKVKKKGTQIFYFV